MADEKTAAGRSWTGHAWISKFKDAYSAFQSRRDALGLSNPGTVENVAKEVQRDVFLTNSMFTGLRADISKAFSVTPMFQTSHGFSMGSQLPPYTFLSSYGTPKVFLHATVDNDGQLAARANYKWSESLVTRTQAQISSAPGQSMVQIDNDYSGKDFSASIKALNPSFLEGGTTGIFIGSYLQSITRSLALGMEAMWQRQAMSAGPDSAVSYVAKYRGSDWIASAQLHGGGALSTSYWRKIGEKVEAGAELNLQLQPAMGRTALMGGRLQKEGVANVGVKYDFRTASFKVQADNTGKLSVLVEKRVLQAIQVAFAGELDQLKQQAKVGVGVSIELPNEEIMEQQEKAINSNLPAPPY